MVVTLDDDQLVLLEVLAAHVPRAAPAVLHSPDSDPLALSDRVEGQADVFAHRAALWRAHRAGLRRQVAIEELAEGALADEADAGRIALGEIVQARVLRDLPHLGLLQLADREQRSGQLGLVQPVQEIALVLREIAGL